MPFNLNSSGLSQIASGPPEVTQRKVYPTAQTFLTTYKTLSDIEATKKAGEREQERIDLQAERDAAADRQRQVDNKHKDRVFEQDVLENQEDEENRDRLQDNFETTEERLSKSQLETERANKVREERAAKTAAQAERTYKLNADKFAHKVKQNEIINNNKELKLKGEMLVAEVTRNAPLDLSPEDRAMFIMTELVKNPNSKYVSSETLNDLFEQSHKDTKEMTPAEVMEHTYRQGVFGMVNLANGNDVLAKDYIAKSNNINPEEIVNLEYIEGDTDDPMDDEAVFYVAGSDQPRKLRMYDYVSKVGEYQGMMNQALANTKGAKQIELENVRIQNKEKTLAWVDNNKALRDGANWSQQPITDEERAAALLVLENTVSFWSKFSEKEQASLIEETIQESKFRTGTLRTSYPRAMRGVVGDLISNAAIEDGFFFGLIGGDVTAGEIEDVEPDTPSLNLKQQATDKNKTTSKPRKPIGDRLEELKSNNIPPEEAEKILIKEGYIKIEPN